MPLSQMAGSFWTFFFPKTVISKRKCLYYRPLQFAGDKHPTCYWSLFHHSFDPASQSFHCTAAGAHFCGCCHHLEISISWFQVRKAKLCPKPHHLFLLTSCHSMAWQPASGESKRIFSWQPGLAVKASLQTLAVSRTVSNFTKQKLPPFAVPGVVCDCPVPPLAILYQHVE